jgi:CubicO group peptidase (beta-lactamase class C family)
MTRRILVPIIVAVSVLSGAVPAPVQAATPATVAGAVARELDALDPPAAAYVVVAPDGTVTVGTRGKGVTACTPFVLGSLSKSFTALAVLQLVDRGRVELDRPVTAYLPRFRTATPGRAPTIRQLLDQSSGLPTSRARCRTATWWRRPRTWATTSRCSWATAPTRATGSCHRRRCGCCTSGG